MLEVVRNAIRMAAVVAEVPRKQAERFARQLARSGEVSASQVSSIAEDIVRRSRQNADMIRTLVTSEIRRQVRLLGLASRDDVDALARRVRKLEAKASSLRPAAARKPQPGGRPVRRIPNDR
jgi:polyhydroxyalkanoate synthesis regulator phasin